MRKQLSIYALLLAVLGCNNEEGPEEIPPEPESPEFDGSGDRDIRESWFASEVPFDRNVQLLSFTQLRNEVDRALDNTPWLGESNEDLWPGALGSFRGANYTTRFQNQRQPSQQWLVNARRMAFSVCGARTLQESGLAQADRVVYDAVDPADPIVTAEDDVAEQVRSLHARFYRTRNVTDDDLQTSLTLLEELQDEAGPADAWSGLCVAYLTSMRFLSF